MDQLTALRALGRAVPEPTDAALARGRALLAAHIADAVPDARTDAAREVAGSRLTGGPRTGADDEALGATPGAASATDFDTASAPQHRAPQRRSRLRRSRRQTTPRRAFVALGGIAAAAVVVTLLLTDALGIGTWNRDSIASSPTATASPPLVFTLPDSCASLVDPSIIAEWSARYGDAPLIGEMGAPLDSPTRPPGRSCSYGSTDTGFPSLTIAVDVFTPDNLRSAREADLRGQGLVASDRPDGTVLYTSDTADASGAAARVHLLSDDADISLFVGGVSASDGPGLVPLLTDWLPRLTARLEVPADGSPNPTPSLTSASASASAASSPPATTGPAEFTLPRTCAETVGSNILPEWSPRFGDATLLGGGGPDSDAGYSVPGTDEHGVRCSYGSNDTGRLLTIIVGTVDSAPGGRARAEEQERLLGTAEIPLGNGTLFDEKLGRDPVTATLTLITDSAIITVGARGTEQGAVELLPYLRAFLDDISARTGANP
ncbi:hypothetical protein B7R54_16550 [Subtercola boreus]|uniref:Uncharacterized protein n=1 Tax=Subtercola boreus TaxID=120213 RepID=A0A3E0VKZ3_9MICO|nr:hypothetical protein [Subtercola boreus]RFA10632.1 hypothetical protein B7R54_16550 [Subtercola boreus]TQL55811.1 hypothetical protein FB464_3385 [Subtercola boreus]